jgi:hypothetical protein
VNTEHLQVALNTLSLGLAELAEALNESPAPVSAGDAGRVAVPPSAPAPFEESPFLPDEFPQPSLADASVEFAEQGSEAMCPRHKREFRQSKVAGKPAYCTAKEDDPKWSRNGFCSINADNVAKWLREQVAA